jgi:hypothetical protein
MQRKSGCEGSQPENLIRLPPDEILALLSRLRGGSDWKLGLKKRKQGVAIPPFWLRRLNWREAAV